MSLPVASPRSANASTCLRVLCADDSKQIRDLLHLLLTHDGHEVTTAPDGLCAHQLVLHDPSRYDVLVTDHNMPGMTGLELVTALRAVDFQGPVLVLCSPLAPEVAASYRRQGAAMILEKPLGFSAVRQAILLLENFAPQREGATPSGPMSQSIENPGATKSPAFPPTGGAV